MTWQCNSCGESLEDQFDSCWKCGFGKDGSEPSGDFVSNRASQNSKGISFQEIPCSTTPDIPGRHIDEIRGIVCGEAIMGSNFLRDMVAGLSDFVGGRSGVYESKLREGRAIALQEMMHEAKLLGGNAVIGVDIDYETVGETMLMVNASGTAVLLKPSEVKREEDDPQV